MMTLAEANERALAVGNHWFEPELHKIAGIRCETEIYPNRCFVTSEIFPTGPERWYLIHRVASDFSSVEWTGELYASLDEALRALKRIV